MDIAGRKKIAYAVIVMGFSGLVAQIVLLRELMVAFLGNELSIGVILANWLLLESAGAFLLGRKMSRAKKNLFWFVLVTILFSLSFVAAIYAVRVFKTFLPVVTGEGLGIMVMFYVSFLILLPVSVLHGALFTSGCKLYAVFSNPEAPVDKEDTSEALSIARIYIFETLGTIAGGIILTYFFIPFLHSFQVAFVLAILNIGICALLLEPFWRPQISNISRAASFLTYGLLLLAIYIFASPVIQKINLSSIEKQWSNQNIVHYQNSHYGNIVVLERGDEYTFFTDGAPAITTPNPDIVFVEEFVHFAMLSHPSPGNILILSGGAGGVINETLKHGVNRVDYAEVDPLLPHVIRKFPTSLTEKEFDDERVHIKDADGRFFLKRTTHTYDVIFSGFSDPSTLQTNRFFTREFFNLANEKLTPDGILILTVPGSLTYLSPGMVGLNGLIYNTLKDAFPFVRVIPGDGTNFYLASRAQEVTETDYNTLIERLNERELQVSLISPGYLEYRLSPRWLEWFYDRMEESTENINSDFRPLGVFYSLIYWNEKFSPAFNDFFKRIQGLNVLNTVGFMTAFFVVFSLIALKRKSSLKPALTLCIFSTGFAGMLFDLILIFAFQVLYGYIFYWLGLLVTAFMAGVMAGGLQMTGYLRRKSRVMPALVKLEVFLIVFAFLLPFIFILASNLLAYKWIDYFLRLVFLVMSFLSGVLVGAQFPLANRAYLKISGDLGGTAAWLYSADLMGGWLGGMIGAVVLLPVLGLLQTAVVIVFLKICSLILLVLASKKEAFL